MAVKLNNKCAVYLVFGSRKMRIPVNPEEIEIERPTDNKTFDVIGLGEIVVPRKPSLQAASWESFFPGEDADPYVNPEHMPPEEYVQQIESALKEQTVCRLVITREGMPYTNMQCIVSEFKTTDKGGEPNDLYYSISLKEYRDYAPEMVAIVVSQVAAPQKQRAVNTPALRVGATVIANGKYWYDSYGSKPYGTANNITTTITRIVEGRPYPVHIGTRGWLRADQLQIVG